MVIKAEDESIICDQKLIEFQWRDYDSVFMCSEGALEINLLIELNRTTGYLVWLLK